MQNFRKMEAPMKTSFLRKVLFIVSALLCCLAVSEAGADNFRMTIGSGFPAEGAVWAGRTRDFFAAEVKKRVESRTPHKIEWVGAFGGSIAKVGEVLEAVESGIMDVGSIVTFFEPSKLHLHGFSLYTPFGSPDIMQVARVGQALFDKVPYMKDVFEKQYGQKFLALGTSGGYNLITTFPVSKMEDLKGKKIAGAGANLAWVKGVDAVPVQSNLPESYTSLQTGVYQGVIVTVDMVVGFKLYEVAKHYCLTDFGAPVGGNVITVNLGRWKRLPKEIQEIMVEVGKEFCIDESKATLAKENGGLEVMKKANMKIDPLPLEEKMRWAKLLPEIPNQMAKEADKKGMPGSVLMKTWIEDLEKDGFKWPRRWVIQ
jgi:TRAP-type C4-dicarboxylate transport system substrate-binding protein